MMPRLDLDCRFHPSSNAVPLKCWPLHENLLAALRIFRGGVAPANHFLGAGGQEFEASEVAVQIGRFFDVFLIELDGDVGAVGLELRRFRGDFDLLAGRTDRNWPFTSTPASAETKYP